MKATSFKETNQSLGAGGNPNTIDLPVAISEDPATSGVLFSVSKWQMTEGERKEFEASGAIWLSVMTNKDKPTQPPVMVTAWNPFDDLNFRPLDYDELQEMISKKIPQVTSKFTDINPTSEEGQLLLAAVSMIGALKGMLNHPSHDPDKIIEELQSVKKAIFKT